MSDRPPLPPGATAGRLTPSELQDALLAGTGQRSTSPFASFPFDGVAQLPPMAPIPQESIVAAAPANKRRKTTDMRFTNDEHKIFLELMEEVLPIGHEQWVKVTDEFNKRVNNPDRFREKAGLQDKFNRLLKAGKKKPTGDPNCPWYIKKAKSIEYMRKNRSNFKAMGTDEEQEDEELEEEEESAMDSSAITGTSTDGAPAPSPVGTTISTNSRKKDTPVPGKPAPHKKKGKKHKTTDVDKEDQQEEQNLIQAIMEVSREDRKEARRRDRRRRKEEAKRDRQHQKFLLAGLQSVTACVVAAITKANVITNPPETYESDSTDDSSSSSSSSDSEPRKKSAS